jgi:hypothetical protein
MVVLDSEDVDAKDLAREVDADAAVTEGFGGTPAQAIEDEASEA